MKSFRVHPLSLCVFYFLPLVLFFALALAITYYICLQTEKFVFQGNELRSVAIELELVGGEFHNIVSDLRFLAAENELQQLFDHKTDENIDFLTREFLSFAAEKKIYDQVRFLDETGMEVVRVNFNDGRPVIVGADELQSKGSRYYFFDTFRQARGDIYVSPFDLNIEHGEIEQPLKPMIRLGIPVFDKNGKKRGIILLNYLGINLLNKMDRIPSSTPTEVMLLNGEGYWLKGPVKEDEWGFMFEEKRARTFARTYPEAWRRILKEKSGQFYTNKGLFTFETAYPLHRGQRTSTGSGKPYEASASQLSTSDYMWKIVSCVPAGIIYARPLVFLKNILFLTFVLFLISAGFAWALAQARELRRQAERALRKAHVELELKVEERTGELVQVNEDLKAEIEKYNMSQAALHELEIRHEQILNAVGEGIYGVDQEGRAIFINPAASKMWGWSEEDLLGRNIHQLVHHTTETGESFAGEDCLIQNTLKTGDVFRVEDTIFWRQDQSSFPAQYTSTPIIRDGEILGAVVTFWDVTDIKRVEDEKQTLTDQLQQAQKMEAVGTLAGGIAHDFNNILTAILGFTELARDDLPDGNQCLREDLDEVYKAAGRARELVKQILIFSRHQEKVLQPVQVHLIVKEALKLLRASIPSTIEIRQQIFAEDKSVMADPTQIHQVLMNLCTNASHAMRKNGGVLEIGLESVEIDDDLLGLYQGLNNGNYLKLTVSDTGHGMDSAVVERIFEPYFSTKKQGEGTGLGMFVVFGIVKDIKGEILVQSKSGVGTTFQVFLPVADPGVVVVSKMKHGPLPRGSEHILVVDDEQPVVNINRRVLERLGYKVTAGTSSVEAMEIFQARPDSFDLVITDQTMPHLTGTELSRRIFDIRPEIPIILCTGFSETVTEIMAKDIGIREFLIKPVIKRDLAETVRRVLEGNST